MPEIIKKLIDAAPWLNLGILIWVLVFSGEPDIADALRQIYLNWAGMVEV